MSSSLVFNEALYPPREREGVKVTVLIALELIQDYLQEPLCLVTPLPVYPRGEALYDLDEVLDKLLSRALLLTHRDFYADAEPVEEVLDVLEAEACKPVPVGY